MQRTTAKKSFGNLTLLYHYAMQTLSDILLLLFCTPTCQPHHVSATQELDPKVVRFVRSISVKRLPQGRGVVLVPRAAHAFTSNSLDLTEYAL